MSAPFLVRHLGPGPDEQRQMLEELGLDSLEGLSAEIVPADILLPQPAAAEGLPLACGEAEALAELVQIAAANRSCRSLIGLGRSRLDRGCRRCTNRDFRGRGAESGPEWRCRGSPVRSGSDRNGWRQRSGLVRPRPRLRRKPKATLQLRPAGAGGYRPERSGPPSIRGNPTPALPASAVVRQDPDPGAARETGRSQAINQVPES